MRISRRLEQVNPSLTLEIDARAKLYRAQGKDVIGLAAGEPDFAPPPQAAEAATEAIEQGLGRYTAVAGHPELRRAAAESISKLNDFNYKPSEIVVSSGAKQSIFNALYVLADPGDEVLILSPYWTSYPEMCRALALNPVIVPCNDNLGIDPTAIASRITERTRAIIVNSPSNPSGRVLSREEMEGIGAAIEGHEIWTICDDIYARLVFEGREFLNLPMVCPKFRERSLIVYGMSKTFAMTGWRIGFVAGPEHIVKKIATVQSHSTSCANTVAQIASAKSLDETDASFVDGMVEAYQERARFVVEFLNEIDGISCQAPEAAFYAFPHVGALFGSTIAGHKINTCLDLATALLDEALIAIVPGEAFGMPNHLRLSFATSMPELVRAKDRLHEFFSKIQR